MSGQTNFAEPKTTKFQGLAPFLRQNIANIDLLPLGQEMLAKLETHASDANLWMNLSLVMFCLGHRDIGLSMQAQALQIKPDYYLLAPQQPPNLRLLLLATAGDLAANTPLDCLLENTDIDLIYYFVRSDQIFTSEIPAHDVLMVAVSEADENLELLASLQKILQNWPKPLLNAPQHIPAVGRNAASRLLQNVPGLLMPPTVRVMRGQLQAITRNRRELSTIHPQGNFPLIIRPVGSHAGRDLDKLTNLHELKSYLEKVNAEQFFISNFIDYSGGDGLFRKYRVALIDGEPFACHMAISSHWMIHYVNAGMYDDAQKRAEEAAFMTEFSNFKQRHQAALAAIYQRTQLDYVCIDCAETGDGQFLVFEIDHAMVVHAMDPVAQFPYKQEPMQKLKDAFRNMLLRRINNIHREFAVSPD